VTLGSYVLEDKGIKVEIYRAAYPRRGKAMEFDLYIGIEPMKANSGDRFTNYHSFQLRRGVGLFGGKPFKHTFDLDRMKREPRLTAGARVSMAMLPMIEKGEEDNKKSLKESQKFYTKHGYFPPSKNKSGSILMGNEDVLRGLLCDLADLELYMMAGNNNMGYSSWFSFPYAVRSAITGKFIPTPRDKIQMTGYFATPGSKEQKAIERYQDKAHRIINLFRPMSWMWDFVGDKDEVDRVPHTFQFGWAGKVYSPRERIKRRELFKHKMNYWVRQWKEKVDGR
jgi:hypothetical protein